MSEKDKWIDPVLGDMDKLDPAMMLVLYDAIMKFDPSDAVKKRYEFYKLGVKGYTGAPTKKERERMIRVFDTQKPLF